MAKTHSSEVDRYLLYWISAGSTGKSIFLNKKFNHTYKNICNEFFCNIKELSPLKPQVIINQLIVDTKDSFLLVLVSYLLFRVTEIHRAVTESPQCSWFQCVYFNITPIIILSLAENSSLFFVSLLRSAELDWRDELRLPSKLKNNTNHARLVC